MGLDIYLELEEETKRTSTGIFIRENGQNKELSYEEAVKRYPDQDIEEYENSSTTVYNDNITHNLNKMAAEAGFYKALWGLLEEVKTAEDLLKYISPGIVDMKRNPKLYKTFDSPNGWGTYDDFIPWLEKLEEACKTYPDATLYFSR